MFFPYITAVKNNLAFVKMIMYNYCWLEIAFYENNEKYTSITANRQNIVYKHVCIFVSYSPEIPFTRSKTISNASGMSVLKMQRFVTWSFVRRFLQPLSVG